MDFQELLSVANYNSHEAKCESSVKRYSTVLPPPKKPDKAGVQSSSIKKFLEKRKADEAAKAAEDRKKKEKLLELRAQNSKNNKKAKIMASRTKDNDFSRIKLSEDDILTKKKIEQELQRKHLMDKKERMKARIELEEKEMQQPKKRKRKSKHGDAENPNTEQCEEEFDDAPKSNKDRDHSSSNGVRKPAKPARSAMSFNDLLKVAAQTHHEPVVVVAKKKEEERPMTKKERKIYLEEQERLRRRQERLEKGIEPSLYNKTPNAKQRDDRTITKNPHVVHLEKDRTTNQSNDSSKFKIPKNPSSIKSTEKSKTTSGVPPKAQQSPKPQSSSGKTLPGSSGKVPPKYREGARPENSVPKNSADKVSIASPPRPMLDPEALAADIEKRVRERLEKQMAENLEKQLAADIEKKVQEKLEKEMTEKYKAALEEQRKKLNLGGSSSSKPEVKSRPPEVKSRPPEVKSRPQPVNGKVLEKSVKPRKELVNQKPLVPKPPPKKPKILNPYLEPPRRRLEPIIPPKRRPMMRHFDDDDDDEDDDMSDFIDDGPSVDNENVSGYIQEIFGYDRNRYIDDDDDDIMETSYSEQLKEEMKSAKLGYLEDLEEERKLKKEEMEKKARMKQKMKLKK